jgi:hypothetical protein
MLFFSLILFAVAKFSEGSVFSYIFADGTCAAGFCLPLYDPINGSLPHRPNDAIPICGFIANCATFTTTFYTCPGFMSNPCTTPVFTTIGQGTATCLEFPNGGGVFLEACGTSTAPTLSPSSASTLCSPQVGLNKKTCDRLISTCGVSKPMKWTGKGCKLSGVRMFDGGCQCSEYCGYSCKSLCKKDPKCNWVGPVHGGTCNSVVTGLPGVAIPRC